MLVRLALVWLSVIVPYTLAGATGGPTGLLPHVLFHPVYIAFLLTTIVLLDPTPRGYSSSRCPRPERGRRRHERDRDRRPDRRGVHSSGERGDARAGQLARAVGPPHMGDHRSARRPLPIVARTRCAEHRRGHRAPASPGLARMGGAGPGTPLHRRLRSQHRGTRVSQLGIPTFGGVILLAAVAWATRAVPTALDAAAPALPAPSDSAILAP